MTCVNDTISLEVILKNFLYKSTSLLSIYIIFSIIIEYFVYMVIIKDNKVSHSITIRRLMKSYLMNFVRNNRAPNLTF